MRTAAFYTLGCKVNQNETGALAQLFEHSGYTVVPGGEPADVYVVNSCTVTNFGDQKSRKWLRRAKRENPGAVTVLTGCYPQAFPEEAAQFMEADLVCGNGDRNNKLPHIKFEGKLIYVLGYDNKDKYLDAVSDWLSDTYGFLHYGFTMRGMPNFEDMYD